MSFVLNVIHEVLAVLLGNIDVIQGWGQQIISKATLVPYLSS